MDKLTRRVAWLRAAAALAQVSPSPRFEAELLLRGALGGESRARFFASLDEELPAPVLECYWDWVEQRRQGMPTQYLLGQQEFMGLGFCVTPAVLIPRPDTEILVEHALQWLQGVEAEQPRVLDLATGSGAVAVSLAVHCPQAAVWATDVSAAALEVAHRNAQVHGVAERVRFLQGSWTEPLAGLGLRFHLIVSNPPYIATAQIAELDSVVQHEPRLALDGGRDGLDCYRQLIPATLPLLFPGGLLAVEVGQGQDQAVVELFQAAGFAQPEVRHDLAGIPRVVRGRRP
ncbi:MAG: peptide chain release factor N(5)-glutamine methyltransferase [Bacillota bacterium]|jgi:release factor glutamine methyltransferase